MSRYQVKGMSLVLFLKFCVNNFFPSLNRAFIESFKGHLRHPEEICNLHCLVFSHTAQSYIILCQQIKKVKAVAKDYNSTGVNLL